MTCLLLLLLFVAIQGQQQHLQSRAAFPMQATIFQSCGDTVIFSLWALFITLSSLFVCFWILFQYKVNNNKCSTDLDLENIKISDTCNFLAVLIGLKPLFEQGKETNNVHAWIR